MAYQFRQMIKFAKDGLFKEPYEIPILWFFIQCDKFMYEKATISTLHVHLACLQER